MLSVFEFVKRNKGKIAVGGLTIGAVFLIRHAISEAVAEHQLEAHHVEGRAQVSKRARREYIYDTNHQSCDTSLSQYLTFIKDKLEREFNVDSLIQQLRVSSDLNSEERKKLWINVEITSFSRIFAFAYSMSLITLSVKSQVSILASEICLRSEESLKETWWSRFFNTMFCNDEVSEVRNSEMLAIVQKVFLKLIQYCLDEGTRSLFLKMRDICSQCLIDISLNSSVDIVKLRCIVESIMDKSADVIDSKFSNFIIPEYVDQCLESENQQLLYLLERLRTVLIGDDCRRMLKILLNYYVQSLIEIIDAKLSNGILPMAKLLPAVANSFDVLAQPTPGSPLHKSLVSVELHEFSKKIFQEQLLNIS